MARPAPLDWNSNDERVQPTMIREMAPYFGRTVMGLPEWRPNGLLLSFSDGRTTITFPNRRQHIYDPDDLTVAMPNAVNRFRLEQQHQGG